jgi:putative peptidoglycan lipid II flippase
MPDSTESQRDDDQAIRPPSQGGQIASGFRIVSVLTLASRVLGMLRDMVMAYAFGAGPVMDAFTVAFRIPNLARRLFGEGALTTAFLPVFVREVETAGPQAARQVTTAVALTLAATLFCLVLCGEIALALLFWVIPAERDAQLLIVLTAIMLPYLLLICLAAQFSAVLHSVERFFWPGLLPMILNVVWISAVFFSIRTNTTDEVRIQFVAAGVVVAGLFQCGLALWAVHSAGFSFASSWRQSMPHVREIARSMGPIVLGLSITQINVITDSLLAWGFAPPSQQTSAQEFIFAQIRWPLEPGTASALFYSQRMHQFPVGVIGVALGTVLFPLLSRHVERGELDQVGRDQTLGLRLALAIGVPASLGLMMLSRPIAVLLFQRGAFTGDDAILTGRCILAYGFGVWASLVMILINRGFYALGDRMTPIRYGLCGVALNVVLNVTFVWPLAGSGLAWATSVTAILQGALLVAAFQRSLGLLNLQEVLQTAMRTLAATGIMATACWATMRWLPMGETGISRLWAVAGPVAISVPVYLGASKLVGLREPFVLLFRQLDD